jgi:hypothetical protein
MLLDVLVLLGHLVVHAHSICMHGCCVEAVEVRSGVCGKVVESVAGDPRLAVLDSNQYVIWVEPFV